jgi:small subunit ribosomal protein S13
MEKQKQKTEGIDKAKKIIRLLATDIDGDLSVINALRRIKGINFMFANAVCNALGIEKRRKIGELSEAELRDLENFINNPNIPKWLLNRRRDMETGNDLHLTKADIDLKKREDINILRRIRAYRGIRHELGLPVRGQRTRSSFRTQKTVGVMKKGVRVAKTSKK